MYRDNNGFDFGGWSEALLLDNLYLKYDYFIFVNSSVSGPFMANYPNHKWTDVFINGLKDNVKLFGSTINTCCEPLEYSHVQSYIFSMDKQTLEYLIECEIFTVKKYTQTLVETIFEKEILMSRKIIEKGWNIGSLLKYYEGVDFTFKEKKPEDYDIDFTANDLMYEHHRWKIWNENEVVFVKGNRIPI